MPLTVGTRLGPYEIGDALGAGGMGEVYRAHDTNLGRDVAIKILPARFTADAERLARFDREARLLAILNHPHIAAIYGIEETGGIRGLVLELVEGQTLAERIAARHALPIAEALSIALQIADALEAAHDKGIVHRDLKPANVKITPCGDVKVLDFGLAKACAAEDSTPDVTQALTTPLGRTLDGTILGTAAYMSPEQARGKPADKRTDIWAFGCVLYEMLTGRRAFAGETPSDVIALIIEREPDWTALPPAAPAAVCRLVRRCLQKDPRQRLHDIADARLEIDDAIVGVAVAPPGPAPAAAARPWLWLVAGVLIGGASLLAWSFARRTPVTTAPSSVSFERITDFVGMEESPAISPDGKAVAFVARAAAKRQIWVRLLAGGSPLQVTRDDVDHEYPRWAPDSSSLLYYSPSPVPGQQGTLGEVSMLGGTPRRIVAAASGGDISHDGRRIAAFQIGGADAQVVLAVIERDRSTVVSSIAVPAEALGKNPRWSPDDQWIAFSTSSFVGFDDGLSVVRSNGNDLRQVTHGDTISGVSWLPDGTGLVYSSSSGSTVLYPPIFNLRVIRTDGAGGRQLTFGDVSYTEPDVHASGRLLANRTRIQSDVWRFPIDGPADVNTRQGVRITRQTGQVQTPSASPDGRHVVYLSDSGGHGNLWVAATDGSNARQITFEHDPRVVLGVPVWSPDGSRIVFIRSQAGVTSEWLVNPDGSGARDVVARGVSAAWSADGRWLYYTVSRGRDSCIEKLLVDEAKAVTVRCGRAIAPGVGADGSTLYFSSRMSGASGWDYEIRRARPENGAFTALARVVSTHIPYDAKLFTPTLSPDERWLTFALTEHGTSDLWLLSSNGGPLRRVTDFGDRATLIVRRVSWSPDSKSLYAAVAETDADIVLIDHVLR